MVNDDFFKQISDIRGRNIHKDAAATDELNSHVKQALKTISALLQQLSKAEPMMNFNEYRNKLYITLFNTKVCTLEVVSASDNQVKIIALFNDPKYATEAKVIYFGAAKEENLSQPIKNFLLEWYQKAFQS